jgi:O-antigen/teichoic acid export membrane protein
MEPDTMNVTPRRAAALTSPMGDLAAPAQPMRPGLLRAMSWSFIGNVFDVSCAWLFMTCLVKLGTTEMVGQYGLAMAYLGPILAFTNMQMRALQATDARQQAPFGVYLATRILTLVVAVIALGVILSVERSSPYVVLLSLLMFFRLAMLAVEEVFLGLLQQQEWIDRMAQVQMISSALLVGSFALGLIVTDELIGGIVVSGIATVVTLIALHIPVARSVHRIVGLRGGLALSFDRQAIRLLLASLIPLGIVSFLISMQSSVPRLFLNREGSTADLGVFVALSTLLTAGIALTASVSQAVVPRLARLRADGNRDAFIQLLVRLELAAIGVLIVGVAGAATIGPFVVRIVYSSEYATYTDALIWLAVACGITLMGWFIGNAITVARRLKIQVLNNLVSLAAMIGFCQVLIPRFGVTGAVVAIAGAASVQVLLNLIVCLRFLATWTTSPIAHEGGQTALTQEESTACVD